jgi:hypothetical protein
MNLRDFAATNDADSQWFLRLCLNSYLPSSGLVPAEYSRPYRVCLQIVGPAEARPASPRLAQNASNVSLRLA